MRGGVLLFLSLWFWLWFWAFAAYADLNTPYLAWKNLPIAIYADKSLPAPFAASVKEATDAWNQALGKNLFDYRGYSADCGKGQGRERLDCVFLEKHAAYLRVSGRDDYAYTRQHSLGTECDQADIFLNSAMRWAHPARVGQVDYAPVIEHELGHVLGLRHHYFDLESIMNYYPYESGVGFERITELDRSIVNWLYFGGSAPPGYVLDFIDGQDGKSFAELKQAFPKREAMTDVNLLYLRARLERTLKLPDESLHSIDRAISLAGAEPPFIRAYLLNHRADLLFSAGKNEAALKDFEASLELAPDNYLTLTYVAYLRSLAGAPAKKTVPLLKRALAIKPTDPLARDLLGKLGRQR